MNDVVVGRVLRALRRRRGWRQIDLAGRAGVSQALVSAVERGHGDATTVRVLRQLFGALEARLEAVVTWRGAALERLLDEDHARLAAATARRLERFGWQTELEVTYSEYGERGSIDVLAIRPAERACLVVEIKTDVPSSEAVGRKVDEKARLAPMIVQARFGWRPEVVGRLVVLPETMRLRRLVAREETLRRLYPTTMSRLRAWLRRPVGAIAGLWFLSDSSAHSARGSRAAGVRVRQGADASGRAERFPRGAGSGPAAPSKTSGAAGR